jgi:hypothetical protein
VVVSRKPSRSGRLPLAPTAWESGSHPIGWLCCRNDAGFTAGPLGLSRSPKGLDRTPPAVAYYMRPVALSVLLCLAARSPCAR